MFKNFLCLIIFIFVSCSGAPEMMKTREIPALDPQGKVYKTLGPTDFTRYPHSLGELKTAFVFVDFAGHPGKEDPNKLARQLTGGDKAADWYKNQSYGKAAMKFEVPSVEWRTMSKKPEEYESRTTAGHKAYIEEALNLFPEINFTKYEFVVIIPSNKKRLSVGTACFSVGKGNGAKTKHGSIDRGVTFGTSTFSETRYYTLIHELGHAMGLPDTYDYSIKGLLHREVVGAWDLMCDTGNGANFLAWHRHKLEWMDSHTKHYVTEKKLTVTLNSLSDGKKLSMLVIPTENTKNPSKVFVVELAMPIRATGKDLDPNKPYGDGVLVYSVDARLATGTRPLVMYPKSKGYSKLYSYTYKAPYLAGDTFEHKDAPFTMKILSREKNGSYKVEIIQK